MLLMTSALLFVKVICQNQPQGLMTKKASILTQNGHFQAANPA